MCKCTKAALRMRCKVRRGIKRHVSDVVCLLSLIGGMAAATIFMFVIPIISEALLITDKNVTGQLTYDVVEDAVMTDYTVTAVNDLQTTVFGLNMASETRAAIDNRAYTAALETDYVVQREYEEKKLAEMFYIADVTLEYPWEGMTFSYDMQKHTYEVSAEYGLDYWLVMGVIARESRFNPDVRGYSNGVTYYGYMQVNWDSVNSARERRNDYTLDPTDPHDNIIIGIDTLAMQIDKTGSEQGGVFAYGVGYGAYCEYVSQGIYTDNLTKKAYKYRDLLMSRPRYSSEEDALKGEAV